MSALAAAIVVAMTKASPPGKSGWSVEPVPVAECSPAAPECPHAKRSTFYGGWVRRETAATARARYARMADALALELADSPDPAGEAGLVVGVAVNESGLREDVEFGRGRNVNGLGKNGRAVRRDNQDDAGGQGRGPSGEVCVMQILPSMARKYGGTEALVGDSENALRRCFRAGIAQLRFARAMCTTKKRSFGGRDVGRLYATVARYGTGFSCTSSNDGKTERRVKTAEWVTIVIRNELARAA